MKATKTVRKKTHESLVEEQQETTGQEEETKEETQNLIRMTMAKERVAGGQWEKAAVRRNERGKGSGLMQDDPGLQ